ncbi:hypothetical protein BGZ76_007244, partial [Entomortierella beljakovae]
TPEDYKGDIDASNNEGLDVNVQRLRKRKYVLTGSIVTNGDALYLQAYCLTQNKPPSNPIANTTSAKLKSILDEYPTGYEVHHEFPHVNKIVVGLDPGIHNTVTATTLEARIRNPNINSITNTDTNPSVAKNLSISQGSMAFMTKKFNRGLQRAKAKKYFNIAPLAWGGDGNQPQRMNISELERFISPITCQQITTGSQWLSWQNLSETILSQVTSVVHVQGHLRKFYGSSLFKIKTRHLKQAKTAILDKGISALIKTTGCKEKWKSPDERPLFVVGDGNFGASRGPVLHQKFISHLKKK